ncbi:MAG: hypothetical protein GY925_01005 [Actinomycetia bacterium]|nr:hypothetical protein [Actinomycetes bacterium]
MPASVDSADTASDDESDRVGVGPHPLPWPDDERLDPELLRDGDRRNVVDRFRYWSREAIVADLDERRHPFHVAIENWEHDLNIGTVVRNANAFLATEVHIVGKKRWNRRGAMVTDRYQHVRHHSEVDGFVAHAKQLGLTVVGVDNLPGSVPIEQVELPERCVLVFGQEGPGLSEAVREAADTVVSISQFGSTRSINAGVASGIAMHSWICQHAAAPAGLSAEQVIAALELSPLPIEGGWFRRTHIDDHGSVILYLLTAGEESLAHRLPGAETWYHHAGAPVRLSIEDGEGQRDHLLGPDVGEGQCPHVTVPGGSWQAALPLGEWSLMSTSMAPPFCDADFELRHG